MTTSNFYKFYNDIIYERRNPRDTERIFQDLRFTNTNIEIELNSSIELYRARIVKNPDSICGTLPFMGFGKKDSLAPPPKETRSHRANYDYIPYLYCASRIDTAINEIKANKSSDIISVAIIRPTKELQIIDFSNGVGNLKGTKKTLFKDLADSYSKPTDENDNPIEYIPTQFITEFIRYELNYDGIKYKSSYGGENYILFCDNSYDAISSSLFKFDGNSWATYQANAQESNGDSIIDIAF